MSMQLKALAMFCVALFVAMFFSIEVSGESAEEQMCVPMGTITIKPPAGLKPTKSTVAFPHSRHFATECRVCHHKWEGQKKIQSCRSAGCHDQISAPEKSGTYLSYSDVSIRYFKYAYHQACIGCHKQIRAKNLQLAKSYQVVEEKLPEAGPSGCIECHPK
jgi:hypothetical protein